MENTAQDRGEERAKPAPGEPRWEGGAPCTGVGRGGNCLIYPSLPGLGGKCILVCKSCF